MCNEPSFTTSAQQSAAITGMVSIFIVFAVVLSGWSRRITFDEFGPLYFISLFFESAIVGGVAGLFFGLLPCFWSSCFVSEADGTVGATLYLIGFPGVATTWGVTKYFGLNESGMVSIDRVNAARVSAAKARAKLASAAAVADSADAEIGSNVGKLLFSGKVGM